ncbi:MAG: acyltransferase family protein [Stellaceae bacterium]
MAEVRTRKIVPALTGIRFFAASYVFVMHYGASALDKAGAPWPIATFLHNGIFGVSVFFVLSGFILAHAHPAPFASRGQYADYVIARFARIYPVYLFVLVLALPVAVDDVPLNIKTAAAVLAMVQSWTDAFAHSGYAWIMQAWTLSVELFFYLSFPFLISVLRRFSGSVLFGLCVIDAVFMISGGTTTITPWIDYAGNVHHPAWPLYLPLPLMRSGEFIFGMLLHTLITRPSHITIRPGTPLCVLLSGAIAVLLSITNIENALSVAAVLVGVLITVIYISDGAFTRLLGSRALVLCGNASYALYLLQGPVHAYVGILMPAPYDRLLCFPIALAAAILVWRCIEVPARRYILALRYRPDRRLHIPSERNREVMAIRRIGDPLG